MIVYPSKWEKIGQSININDIEKTIFLILADVNINHLSLSGGIDSSLMLYYMTRVFGNRNVYCYTIALNEQHPDYIFSKKITEYFDVKWHSYIPNQIPRLLDKDHSGDEIVRCFYDYLKSLEIDKIIACDGIDEYMCGYYEHQKDPSEEKYFEYINRLQVYHLKPLHENSGTVKVYLPFLDERLISLLSQIPLKDKVNTNDKKKIMIEMAKGKLPNEIIQRWKYGFCDAMKIK